MKQQVWHLLLRTMRTVSIVCCMLVPWAVTGCSSSTITSVGGATAPATTAYPTKTVYQMKSVQPDVNTWGTPYQTTWNANFSNVVGNQAGGIVQNFVWANFEPSYDSTNTTCTTSQVSFEGHCFTIDPIADATVKEFTDQGLAVTGILYGTPSWASTGKSCAGSQWCSPNNPADYARFVRFIANRYNGNQFFGRVVDFVIDNEVNEQSWYNCGCSSTAGWEKDYANNFNAAYDAVKAEQANAKVLISLDHVWGPSLDTSTTISGSEFLTAFASQTGSRSWQVAFHPYSIVVGSPTFSPDDINSGYITFGDIGALVGWLQQNYPGTAAATNVELTESGFDSNTANGRSQSGQATAVCNSFYNVVGTPGIDNYVYHRLVDNTAEGGVLLGLWQTNFTTKASWGTWALANRKGSYNCGFSANDYTTLTESYSASRGHWTSSRLAPTGFTAQHSFNLLRSAATGATLLYECQVSPNKGNMISNSAGCEGSQTNLGPVGYVYTSSASGLTGIYRCHTTGTTDYFISTSSVCDGQSVDYLLGYATQIN